jgi:hypothetical protein
MGGKRRLGRDVMVNAYFLTGFDVATSTRPISRHLPGYNGGIKRLAEECDVLHQSSHGDLKRG